MLYTKKEYADFQVALEIKLPKNGNNGLGIRYPGGTGDGAYIGMCELQVLDDDYQGIDVGPTGTVNMVWGEGHNYNGGPTAPGHVIYGSL